MLYLVMSVRFCALQPPLGKKNAQRPLTGLNDYLLHFQCNMAVTYVIKIGFASLGHVSVNSFGESEC